MIFKGKNILFIFLLFAQVLVFAQNTKEPTLEVAVYPRDKGYIDGVKITILQNGKEISVVNAFIRNGFVIYLPFNKDYVIKVQKEAYLDVFFDVSTVHPVGFKPENMSADLEVKMIQAPDDRSIQTFDKPVAKVDFQGDKSVFDSDWQYEEDILKEIKILEDEIKKLNKKNQVDPKKAEEEAKKLAEQEALKKSEEEAKKLAEETARKKAEEEAKKLAEETARKKAEEEAKKLAEETARKKAEEEAKKLAEETARKKAEEEAKKIAEETARKKAETEAKITAEKDAEKLADEEARKKEEEEERRKQEAIAKYREQQKLKEQEKSVPVKPEIDIVEKDNTIPEVDFDNEEEKEKYLSELAKKYGNGIHREQFKETKRIIDYVVVVKDGKADEYKKIKYN